MRSKLLVPLLAALPAVALLAQSSAPPPPADEKPEDFVIRVETDVVNVLATVRDKKGNLVTSLTKDDFEIYEDGEPQEVRYFTTNTDLPLTIGLLVDTSVSQERLLYEERSAGFAFYDAVIRKAKDLAFLMSFDVDIELLQDLTSSKNLLHDGLEQLRIQGGGGGITPGPVPQSGKPVGTAMYDAIYLAADEVLKPQVGRKAIVLITDGNDYGSHYSLDEALAASHKSDVVIYSVRYFDREFYFRSGGFGTGGGGSLKKLAQETGGSVHEVSRKHTLKEILDEINAELRSQYSIGYSPKRDLSQEGFRKLQVRVKPKGYDVQAREGYYPSAVR
ncbi:MAG: VWA domain-containing protein [Acidobacteria bacterium]|nr:VWA domain-containing protein [Acidobacteriota bacterium]